MIHCAPTEIVGTSAVCPSGAGGHGVGGKELYSAVIFSASAPSMGTITTGCWLAQFGDGASRVAADKEERVHGAVLHEVGGLIGLQVFWD